MITEICLMNIQIYFEILAQTKLGLCAKIQKPWITNSSRKVTRRERRRRRENNAINSAHLVPEEESLEELQGFRIF